jgi:hypothetical protein
MTLDEYLQQQGYVYRPENRFETDGGMSGNFGGYGKYRTVGGGEVPEEQVFDEIERSETAKYYDDPSRFITNRETQFGQGLNTFDEGNPDQKRILDQINSGQLYISPRLVAGKVRGEPEGGGEGYIERKVYDLRDARTGQIIQDVTPIDEAKGIFNIFADDKNSSGFFNNYVTTDAKGFVNPIVSEQQSQYQSRKNSSADFYRNAGLGLLSMTGLAFPGLGEALGAATSLGNVGGNIALNTGINAIKQGITGQFNPLGLATSAALSYGLGGAGGENINLPSETPYVDLPDGESLLTPNVVTPDVSTLTDDASRLAQMLKEFENPTELTGPTIDTAGRATVTLEDGVIDSQAPIMPSNLQDTAYLDPGLIDVAPENVTIGTPDTSTYYNAIPTFPTLDVLPEYDPSAYLPTNLGGTQDLGGFDNIPSNLGTNLGGEVPTDLGGIDVPFDTTGMDIGFKNPDLSAGELTVSGTQDTFDPWDNPEPPPYTPFEENFPIQEEPKTDTTAKTNAIKLGNLLKSSLQQSALTQQKLNLSNALRGSQMPQTALPSIYKQANPFNFGQQALPVQDVSALAKLLRTA